MDKPLTLDKLLHKDGSDAKEQFMARAYEGLGSQVQPRELENIGLEYAPQYDPYEDETRNEQTFPQPAEVLEPMPEVGDHYIGAEILLPRGNEIAGDHVVAWSHDASGNIMRRAIPILSLILECIKLSLLGARFQS